MGSAPAAAQIPTSRTRARRLNLTSALFVAPAILLVLGLLVYPIIYSIWLSLEVVESDGGTSFGFGNYAAIFTDPVFAVAFRNTLLFAAISILGTTAFGLAMALVLNVPSRLRAIGRVAMIIPWSMSQVAVAVIWGWIYNGSYGALNGVLSSLGLLETYKTWLNEPAMAFTLLGFAFIWSSAPFAGLLFLSGLQAIPAEQYQAAEIDGAGPVQQFRHITLPWLRTSFLVVLIVASLEGFLAFTLIYMLTHGGPGHQTSVLAYWGFTTTFAYDAIQKGAAIFYFLTSLVMVTSIIYLRLLRRPLT